MVYLGIQAYLFELASEEELDAEEKLVARRLKMNVSEW